jgi:pimeloyl-ACP methyl ester carboxylesterase
VLRGSESIVTSADGIRALADGLPNRELREIQGGSHMLLLEHPDVVAFTVRDFFSRQILARASATLARNPR